MSSLTQGSGGQAPALIVQDGGAVNPVGAVAVRVVVLLAPLSTTVNVLVAGPVVMLTVVVPVPTAPKPKLAVLLSVSPTAMLDVIRNELPYASFGTTIVKAVEEFFATETGQVRLYERVTPAELTEIVAVPVRLGELALAVRLLEPAANRVADRVVVLTPLVNATVLVG